MDEGQNWLDSEERAWALLADLSAEDVSQQARVRYDGLSSQYTVPLFDEEIFVSLKSRKIWGNSAAAKFLLNKLRYYSRLSILWYLIQAKDVPLSGKLINPGNMSGGLIFQQGSHILPLDKVTQRYGNDFGGSSKKARNSVVSHLITGMSR